MSKCIFSQPNTKGQKCEMYDETNSGCSEGLLNWLPYGVPPCFDDRKKSVGGE